MTQGVMLLSGLFFCPGCAKRLIFEIILLTELLAGKSVKNSAEKKLKNTTLLPNNKQKTTWKLNTLYVFFQIFSQMVMTLKSKIKTTFSFIV